MARKEIGTPLDRKNRNNHNDNFKELYDEFGNVIEKVSNEAFDKIVDSAKLDWSTMVDKQSDLPSNVKKGTTIGVKENSKVYRYNGTNWIEIYEINLNPIAEVDSRLSRQLAEKAKQLSEFDPTGDGVTDDTLPVSNWVKSNINLFASIPAQNYLSDQIDIAETKKIYGNFAKFIVNASDKRLFNFVNTTKHIRNIMVEKVEVSQPASSTTGDGTDNNHSPISFVSTINASALFNIFKDAALGVKFAYGNINLDERSSYYNLAAFNYFENLEKMAIENLGASYSRIVGNAIDGQGASSHGIRSSGYGLDNINTPSLGHVGSANIINGMQNAYSLQNTAKYNSFGQSSSKDISQALVDLKPATNDENVVEYNSFTGLTFVNVGRIVYNHGAGFNNVEAIGENVTERAIEEISTSEYANKGNNHYKLKARNLSGGGGILRYPRNKVDIDFSNVTGTGLQISVAANGTVGDVKINGATLSGVTVASSENVLRIHAENITNNALSVTGNDNIIEIYTDGDVVISGDNNIIKGHVGGNLTSSGNDNDLTGVKGFNGRGRVVATTNENGRITFEHGLKTNILSVMTNYMGGSGYTVNVTSISATSITVEARNTAGDLVTSEEVIFYWIAEARI